MMFATRFALSVLLAFSLSSVSSADTLANKDTQADQAFAKYGLTGKGVIVAILDRGIDYTHPDFRNADGTTRIKMMWDMSGQNLCSSNNPAPLVYTEAEINHALSTNTPLAERDAVGHGTVTAGIAAGNGSAVPPSSSQYAGFAPEADLLIVKVTSEGAPAHGNQQAESPPGGNIFAAYGLNSYWETFSFNLIHGGKGYYGRQSATSGASPILEGTAALLLQMNPKLTSSDIRSYIHQSALTDDFTGTTPNANWGFEKINVLGAADLVAANLHTDPKLSATTLTFPSTPVGETSATQTVTLRNAGTATDALGITSIAVTGDFHVKTGCGSSLAAGGSCRINVTFEPTATGTRTGTITIKDFNTGSPQTISLTGTGS